MAEIDEAGYFLLELLKLLAVGVDQPLQLLDLILELLGLRINFRAQPRTLRGGVFIVVGNTGKLRFKVLNFLHRFPDFLELIVNLPEGLLLSRRISVRLVLDLPELVVKRLIGLLQIFDRLVDGDLVLNGRRVRLQLFKAVKPPQKLRGNRHRRAEFCVVLDLVAQYLHVSQILCHRQTGLREL